MNSTAVAITSPPAHCDRIIIVGAGGLGREVLQWVRHAWPEHSSKIAGFLSADPAKLDGHAVDYPIVGDPEDFKPRLGDGFLLAIGIRRVRRKVVNCLQSRGARFLTLIHPTAIVADTANIGDGTIVCPYVILSDACDVGRFVLLNYYASVAHSGLVDEFAVLSPYSCVTGGAKIGKDVFLGVHAVVGPGIHVGDGSCISNHSWARFTVGSGSLVYGNPATVKPFVEIPR